jgi:ubiquitin-conjugating enzyme (huntingtin interacting protein 2)
MLGTYRFKESVSSLSSDHYVCFHPFLQYLRDYSTFSATARYWTEAFAKNSSTGMEEKVQKLVEMGFPEDMVRSVLKSVNGDENMALEKLCSG